MTFIRNNKVYASERLYMDARQSRILREGDKEAAILLAPKDGEIPARLVEKFGLFKEIPVQIPPAGPEVITKRKTRVPPVLKER